MNRDQFLTRLNDAIKKLPHDERQDILNDFEEHFDIGTAKGKTEEEIAAALGNPNQIAKELSASYYLDQAEAASSPGNIVRAVWAAISLGFYNFAIVLGPFIGLVALVMSGWLIAVSFLASPLLVLLNLVISPSAFEFFDLFVSIAMAGLGLLTAIGMMFVSRKLIKGFAAYARYHVKLVKGGLKR